jgi:hypothetical protein
VDYGPQRAKSAVNAVTCGGRRRFAYRFVSKWIDEERLSIDSECADVPVKATAASALSMLSPRKRDTVVNKPENEQPAFAFTGSSAGACTPRRRVRVMTPRTAVD